MLASVALDKVAPPRGLGSPAKVDGETVPSRSRGKRGIWRDAGVPSVGERRTADAHRQANVRGRLEDLAGGQVLECALDLWEHATRVVRAQVVSHN